MWIILVSLQWDTKIIIWCSSCDTQQQQLFIISTIIRNMCLLWPLSPLIVVAIVPTGVNRSKCVLCFDLYRLSINPPADCVSTVIVPPPPSRSMVKRWLNTRPEAVNFFPKQQKKSTGETMTATISRRQILSRSRDAGLDHFNKFAPYEDYEEMWFSHEHLFKVC